MLLYFDTNIYRLVTASAEADAVRRFLHSRSARLVGSAANLLETFAIPDSSTRAAELHTLTRLADQFERHPRSYVEARDVRLAMKARRPDWFTRTVFTRRIRSLLAGHLERWHDARAGRLPDPGAYAQYRRDAESGTAGATTLQRQVRSLRLSNEQATILKKLGASFVSTELPIDDPAAFWRVECWLAYEGAIIQRHPSTRDLADWLTPYFRDGAPDPEGLLRFWLRDVDPSEVPRSRWAGLVSWGQLAAKVSHGNPADQLHSLHALDVEIFLTADSAFYTALQSAASHFNGSLAQLRLVDRGASSATDAIAAALP